jgi:hypothetical protein
MVCFQTKNPNLGKCLRGLDWKMFIYFMAIWTILWRFGIFYDHLVHFSGFGIMYQEKSGNPANKTFFCAVKIMLSLTVGNLLFISMSE